MKKVNLRTSRTMINLTGNRLLGLMFMKAGCFISGNTHPAKWKAMHYNSHMCQLLSCTHLDASFLLGANDDQVLVAHHAFNGQTRSTCLIPLKYKCRQCMCLAADVACKSCSATSTAVPDAPQHHDYDVIVRLFCSNCMIGNLYSQGNTVHVMCSTI